MPIYVFACRSCGGQFEELTKMGETPPCPSCGGADLERLIAPASTLRIGLRGGDARRSEATRRDRRERAAEKRRRGS